MSIGASIYLRSIDPLQSESCHFMPCAIDHNGEANISRFFSPTIDSNCESKGKDECSATFRGRPLNGQELKVPSGYTGLVLHEPHQRSVEDETRRLIVTNTFDKFMYWNLDRQPTQDDPFKKALQWIDISEAIHKPVPNIPALSSQESSLKGH